MGIPRSRRKKGKLVRSVILRPPNSRERGRFNLSEVNSHAIARRDALVSRLFDATLGAWDLLAVYIGDRLGFYRTLVERGPLTSPQLAAATGTHERYVREWLEQHASTGILDVEDAGAVADARRYSLPPGHDEVLLDESSLNYMAPIGRLFVACTRPLDALLQVFRSGDGIPYSSGSPGHILTTPEGIRRSRKTFPGV